ncbi:hypothetical protein SAMN05216167_10779 [Spirosoma endophyticum]|uniref:Uncharacterized protein n=1 Tax=Spirosoma endophyticum TaxID=662367 RepID=A0A1I1V826_9BACT|nr:hypothetical protein SAMN05216167_10779 [Spirosoma endophyticum]
MYLNSQPMIFQKRHPPVDAFFASNGVLAINIVHKKTCHRRIAGFFMDYVDTLPSCAIILASTLREVLHNTGHRFAESLIAVTLLIAAI